MKRDMKNIGRGLFTLAIASVCVIGFDAGAPSADAACPSAGCPSTWAPVKCRNGIVYQNACFAKLAGQVGCVQVDPYNPL